MTRARTTKTSRPSDTDATKPSDSSETDTFKAARSPRKAVSKSDAARAALDAGHAGPQEAIAFIKKNFGIDMSPQHFSAVKSIVKKKEAEAAGASTKAASPKAKSSAIEGYLAPPPRSHTKPDADLLDAMESMKPLIAQYGSDKVKRIVDLLG